MYVCMYIYIYIYTHTGNPGFRRLAVLRYLGHASFAGTPEFGCHLGTDIFVCEPDPYVDPDLDTVRNRHESGVPGSIGFGT